MSSISKPFLFLFFLFSIILTTYSQKPHPLDPLNPPEINLVQTIIHNSYPKSNQTVNFHYVGLEEPPKSTIHSWLKNPTQKPPNRQSFVIARINKTTHELIVDLTLRRIISDRIYDGYGFPTLTFAEQTAANQLPFQNAAFLESIKRRGLEIEETGCMSFGVGWFGEKKRSKRIVRVMCYYLEGTVNLYMRPIEGVTLTVDLDEMVIVGFIDRQVVPVPKAGGTDYRGSEQVPPFPARLRGVRMVQPDPPNFEIDGHNIR